MFGERNCVIPVQLDAVGYLVVVIGHDQGFILQNISFLDIVLERQYELLLAGVFICTNDQSVVRSLHQRCCHLRNIASRIYRCRIELERVGQQNLVIARVIG
ncbi:hypothetical protein D3C73_1228970 [compost metagenome]